MGYIIAHYSVLGFLFLVNGKLLWAVAKDEVEKLS